MGKSGQNIAISIHALLAESDHGAGRRQGGLFHFYPRSPCGERRFGLFCLCFRAVISIHALLAESDRREIVRLRDYAKFLSTLSLRRATRIAMSTDAKRADFYPRSPCGERQRDRGVFETYTRFLSTLSLRRATTESAKTDDALLISIHALLAESDVMPPTKSPTKAYFYPRSPCGERLMVCRQIILFDLFLSTLSLRRAT